MRIEVESRMIKKRVEITLTKIYVDALDQLVEKGIYMDRQAVIRDSLRRLFRFYGIAPFYKELVKKNEKIQD